MLTIPGYKGFEKIAEGGFSEVYRALRIEDGCPVVIKIDREDPSIVAPINRFWQDYEITSNLKTPSIVKPYSLEQHQGRSVLVLEDFDGISLKMLLNQGLLSVSEGLNIAVKAVHCLIEIHSEDVIHKDIKPSNFIYNPEQSILKLNDFGFSVKQHREVPDLTQGEAIEGTLAYMSPEQTGRINRSVDYRSDLYSLGVTFYEIFTGTLPFESTDPMELVHSHIAKEPLPPHSFNPSIPIVLSEIILKLLAKPPEDRYKSAFGLKADLEACQTQYRTIGDIKPFPLGSADVSGKFLIPQKLYGRGREFQVLMHAFAFLSRKFEAKRQSSLDVDNPGGSELLLVSGQPGTGKTMLIQELHKPVVRLKGYFIQGKFDPFQRNTPYSAVIQAFQELVKFILIESLESVERWRLKMLNALGKNGGLITSVIPELELILGVQPHVEQVGPVEAHHRFHRIFLRFVAVFTDDEYPLVLFLDDLHWADTASLDLLKELTLDPDPHRLLLIGSYQDNEVDENHPLMITIAQIERIRSRVETVNLQPLTVGDLKQLLADTLECSKEQGEPLAALLHQKTKGNPFFVREFLHSIDDLGLLKFAPQVGWFWDLEKIKEQEVTENVVELMAETIAHLPQESQTILKWASCIGFRFSIDLLSLVAKKSHEETYSLLQSAFQAGILVHTHETQHFIHDRVREASYLLIPEDERQSTHYKIGRLLLDHNRGEHLEEVLFEVTNQLNMGTTLVEEPDEIYELAQLNLRAGQKAKSATAFSQASSYFETGTKLLDADCWQNHHELIFTLEANRAECTHLSGVYAEAEKQFDHLLEMPLTRRERVRTLSLRMAMYGQMQKMELAFDTLKSAMALFELGLPEDPDELESLIHIEKTKIDQFRGKPLDHFMDLPPMTDPDQLTLFHLLTDSVAPLYYSNPTLLAYVALKLGNLAIEQGNSKESAFAYMILGYVLCTRYREYESGNAFGELALSMIDQWNEPALKNRSEYIYASFISHWKRSLRSTAPFHRSAFQYSLDMGDLYWAGLSAVAHVVFSMLRGVPLREVYQICQTYLTFTEKLQSPLFHFLCLLKQQQVLAFQGRTLSPTGLTDSHVIEDKIRECLVENGSDPTLFHYFHAKECLCYWFEDYDGALAMMNEAEKKLDMMNGYPTGVEHHFIHALILTATYFDFDAPKKEELSETLQQIQAKMKRLSENCPDNYLHKYLLISAEIARVEDRFDDAGALYDLAVESAHTNGYAQIEALANELAAKFYLARKRKFLSNTYLAEALRGYTKWGAHGKVHDLEQRYPWLQSRVRFMDSQKTMNSIQKRTISEGTSLLSSSGKLDMNSVLKSTQALSSEIHLDHLLEQMIDIMIENAGAQKGLLILQENEQWVIRTNAQAFKSGEIDQQCQSSKNRKTTWVLLSDCKKLSIGIVNYVIHNQRHVVLGDAHNQGRFIQDEYVVKNKSKSILCNPIIHQGVLVGILYLENNLFTNAFTQDRLEVLRVLSVQAAISLENARLYRDQERLVEEKTRELKKSLKTLQNTQDKLIVQEKLATLGTLTAGIAHEINNPLNIVLNYAALCGNLVEELEAELEKSETPPDPSEISDLLKMILKSASEIKTHGKRTDEIVKSMQLHSRETRGVWQPYHINMLLEQACNEVDQILKNKKWDYSVIIDSQFHTGLDKLDVVPQDLHRVFVNIMDNACYAMEQKHRKKPNGYHPTLRISTLDLGERIEIRIRDNGEGIARMHLDQIFEPFFTTKPPGAGTGLGLSLSYEIIVREHQGTFEVTSVQGEHTEFCICLPK